jgi:hypothetical protein
MGSLINFRFQFAQLLNTHLMNSAFVPHAPWPLPRAHAVTVVAQMLHYRSQSVMAIITRVEVSTQ